MYISDTIFTSAPSAEGRLERENRVYRFLDEHGIEYSGFDHDAADTMEICELLEEKLGAKICKNLFLCNRQETVFYLLMMPGDKPFKTKFLSEQINSSRLSFGSPANMERLLGVVPGSASVMGLLSDTEHAVNLLIDKDLLSEKYTGVHPCVSTSVLKIRTQDILDKILPALGYSPVLVDLPRVFD